MAARAENQLCSVCGNEPSTMYCTCANVPTYLCEDCFMPHRKKNPRLVHTIVPMEVADISQYQERCKRFAEGQAELRQNLARIDQCCAEVTAIVDALITRAQEFRTETLAKLQGLKEQMKRDIDAALAEVESSLGQEHVELQSAYSAYLRNYTPGCLTIFKFEVESNTVDDFLQSLLTTESKQPGHSVDWCLFWVTGSEIMTFNTLTLQTKPSIRLSKEITKSNDSRFVALDAGRLVVCGGSSLAQYSAYLVNSQTGNVTDLPNMAVGHCSPGIIVYRGDVHIFGSYYEDGGNRCERLRLNPTMWSALPDMHSPRSYFTPVLWQSAVYLCGNDHGSNIVEVFNGVSMALLNITIPEGGDSIACAREDQLLVITQHCFIVLSRPANTASMQVASKSRNSSSGVVSYTNPVLLSNVIVQFKGEEVYRYSVEDGSMLG